MKINGPGVVGGGWWGVVVGVVGGGGADNTERIELQPNENNSRLLVSVPIMIPSQNKEGGSLSSRVMKLNTNLLQNTTRNLWICGFGVFLKKKKEKTTIHLRNFVDYHQHKTQQKGNCGYNNAVM